MLEQQLITISTTVLVAATAAGLLTPMIARVVGQNVRWLKARAHIVLAALGGAGAAVVAEGIGELVAFAAAAVGCSVLIVIDLAVHRLPDKIVVGTWGALVVALTVAAATGSGWGNLGRALLAALVLVVGYFVLAYINPAGLGLGDVKFAAVIGAFLGWFGWTQVALGTILGFLLNGLIALVVLIRTKRARDAEVPFGPSMVFGAALAVALTL